MKKKFFSMKHKFVIMVASLLLCFVLATTVIWGVAFTREISERGVEYAREMTESANKNVEGYLKKLRLIAYILQNNSLAKPILNKTSYSNDSERLTDMKNMQLLLKAVMTGAEYMQNIYVFTENGMEFSAGGARCQRRMNRSWSAIKGWRGSRMCYFRSSRPGINTIIPK